jgi:ribonuclease-3
VPGPREPARAGDVVERAQHAIGLTFKNPRLLQQALVHRSYVNEAPGLPFGSNERLEYLGDAVVGLIVSDYLYEQYPDATEGVLSAMRATLVRFQTLGRAASRLGLGELIYMSKGEARTPARPPQRLLGQAYEAVVGAIYLDLGLDAARRFVLASLAPDLAQVPSEHRFIDPKSRLQELTQERYGRSPSYALVGTRGPGHRPRFLYEARLGPEVIGSGEGETKQDAEEAAARHALESLLAHPTRAQRPASESV